MKMFTHLLANSSVPSWHLAINPAQASTYSFLQNLVQGGRPAWGLPSWEYSTALAVDSVDAQRPCMRWGRKTFKGIPWNHQIKIIFFIQFEDGVEMNCVLRKSRGAQWDSLGGPLYMSLTKYAHSFLNKVFARLKGVKAQLHFFIIITHCTNLCVFRVS